MNIQKIHWGLGSMVVLGLVGLVVFLKFQFGEPVSKERQIVVSPLQPNAPDGVVLTHSKAGPAQPTAVPQTVSGKSYIVHPPNSKPANTITMNNQKFQLHEGENKIYLFREGVDKPRPLNDTERKRLLELRELIWGSEISKEERSAYAEEVQEILKNIRQSGYSMWTVTAGKIPPEIMNLPLEERRQRLVALGEEQHARTLERAQQERRDRLGASRPDDDGRDVLRPQHPDEAGHEHLPNESLVTPHRPFNAENPGSLHPVPPTFEGREGNRKWPETVLSESELLLQIESALGFEIPKGSKAPPDAVLTPPERVPDASALESNPDSDEPGFVEEDGRYEKSLREAQKAANAVEDKSDVSRGGASPD